jgi:hypothetical protein
MWEVEAYLLIASTLNDEKEKDLKRNKKNGK